MFTIHNTIEESLPIVTLQNEENSTSAKINLSEGGSIKELKLNNKYVIKEISSFEYKGSYASSILFPFANRIENGTYLFEDKEYHLKCNDNGKNALHGLVYNKEFKIVEKIKNKNFATIIISYYETNNQIGFPFTYHIQLTYTLFENEISLSVEIENTDAKAFPFTLGWHPYFFSDDLPNSTLTFKSDHKIKFNKNLITKSILDIQRKENLKIGNSVLDDCFILNSNIVAFKTPSYKIEVTSDQAENYLQLYTPKGLPIIAIELMTGISNSHNNKIGLQVLEAKKTHSLNWNIKII